MDKKEYEKKLMELIDLSLEREKSLSKLIDELRNLILKIDVDKK